MKCKTKYQVRMLAGIVGYGLGLVALSYFYNGHSSYRYALVALPVVTIVYLVATIISYVSGLDEMWRKIITEAAAFSCIATGFTCFTYLFLRDMGAPEFHAEWAFYIMWFYYGIGAAFSWRRYK